MKEDFSPLKLERTSQAEALAHPFAQTLLAELLESPGGAQELANRLAVPLHRVKYRLTSLLEQDLICVYARRHRAGRAIRVYAARAAAYSLPLSLTRAATFSEFVERDFSVWLAPLLERLNQQVLDPVTLVFAKHQGHRAYFDFYLSAADRRRLERTRLISRELRLTDAQLDAVVALLEAQLDAAQSNETAESPAMSFNLSVIPIVPQSKNG